MAWIESHQLVNNLPIKPFGEIDFITERDMEDFIVLNWKNLFDFTFWSRQYRINVHNRIDIIGHNIFQNKHELFILELKVGVFKKSHEIQALRYCKQMVVVDQYYKKFNIIGVVLNYYDEKIFAHICHS